MSKKALKLICCCALPPNALGFCGKDSAPQKFINCVTKGDCAGIQQEIQNFKTLYPYLSALAEILHKPIFSYEVATAYWFGSDLLNIVTVSDYEILMRYFLQQGLPQEIVTKLQQNPPVKFIPTHLFQLLYISAMNSPTDIASINKCMIRWGIVEKVESSNVRVKLNSLRIVDSCFELYLQTETAAILPEFIINLKPGDNVMVHWGQATRKLTKTEVKQITKWTHEVIEAIPATYISA
jgi:hypothetical protein